MKNIFKILVCLLVLTTMTPSAQAYSYQYPVYNYPRYSYIPLYTYPRYQNIVTRPNYTSSYVSSTNSRVVGFGGYTPIYYR